MQGERVIEQEGTRLKPQVPSSSVARGISRFGLTYGRLVYRWRWFILLLWLLALGVSVPFAQKLPKLLTSGGYAVAGSESAQVANTLTNDLHVAPAQAWVVFQSFTTAVSDPAYQREIQSVQQRLRVFPHVSGIEPGIVGRDGRTTFLLVRFNADDDTMQRYIGDMRNSLPTGKQASPAQVYLTGTSSIIDELNNFALSETEQADAKVFPIALLVLLIIFGTFTAALLPLLLAGLAIPITLALLYPLALHITLNSLLLSVASMVGLGISIDYSLLMVRRFREELARGLAPPEALGQTVATAGEAILFSGLTVMISFSGLLLIGVQTMSAMGIGGTCVICVALLVALTLLPAILGIMGTRINALRLPWLWRLTLRSARPGSQGEHGWWQRLARGVMRCPLLIILLVCLIQLGLTWPAFFLKVGNNSSSILPAGSQARQGMAILQHQYPSSTQNPVNLIVKTSDGKNMLTEANLRRLLSLEEWLERQRHVTGITALFQPPVTPTASALSRQQLFELYRDGTYQRIPALYRFVTSTTNWNLTWVTLKTDTQLDSEDGKALIEHLRGQATRENAGLQVLVGGNQAAHLDFDHHLYSSFPRALLFIMAATYVLLLLMFRSILLPFKALLMNILSIGATYGVLVFVFQWGHFSRVLGFSSQGFIDSLIPILLFCILFGLSMDYEVFLLSRIREEWLRSEDNTRAVALGLEKTGGVITNAALLFMIVTTAFTFTQLIITKELGLGMTIALLVDATIIRMLLVPATMCLLGRWNWFPGSFAFLIYFIRNRGEKHPQC